MGILETLIGPLAERAGQTSNVYIAGFCVATFIAASIFLNVLSQVFLKDKTAPPVVFHWIPFIGSTISYGIDPYPFFFKCREKYGDVFTFILLGKKTTVFLGTKGNDFILNGKISDLNAEEIYQPLTMPVFGKDVVYDCPNAKLMEQKKFVKFGLTTEAFREYVPLIVKETTNFLKNGTHFKLEPTGTLDVPPAMGELTLYTASRALQGKEVRDKFNAEFAELFHDLDAGFQPINFMMPWAPLPQNRKRDAANRKMAKTYLDIIIDRRAGGEKKDSEDMIWNLMKCKYKNGQQIPDREISHMMIALLMAGQHSSATTASFILLRLAANPTLIEELLDEQRSVLADDLPALKYEDLSKLPLHNQVVKETLRIHAPIHSVMRKVTKPMPIEGTPWTIPTSHTLLAAPGVTSRQAEYFPSPDVWDPHRWDKSPDDSAATKAEAEEEKIDYGYGLVSKGTTSPYLPFGAGRHRCIGEHFAYLQLTTILATMVRELKWRTPAGMEGKVPATDYSSLFSRPMRPAKILWERRKPLVETQKSK